MLWHAEAVLAFCRMLTSVEREQCAYFTRMEEAHSECGFKWRDVLVSASGRTRAQLTGAAAMLDGVDLSDARATLRPAEAAGGAGGDVDAGGDRLPASQDDQPASQVDACCVALGMSKEDLLGGGPAVLEDQPSNARFAVAAIEARSTYPVQYDGREFQVRLHSIGTSCLRWCM